jgi:hypothetical protein
LIDLRYSNSVDIERSVRRTSWIAHGAEKEQAASCIMNNAGKIPLHLHDQHHGIVAESASGRAMNEKNVCKINFTSIKLPTSMLSRLRVLGRGVKEGHSSSILFQGLPPSGRFQRLSFSYQWLTSRAQAFFPRISPKSGSRCHLHHCNATGTRLWGVNVLEYRDTREYLASFRASQTMLVRDFGASRSAQKFHESSSHLVYLGITVAGAAATSRFKFGMQHLMT